MVTPSGSPRRDKEQDLTAEGYVGQIGLQALLGWKTNGKAEAKGEWESHLRMGGSDFAERSGNWQVAVERTRTPPRGSCRMRLRLWPTTSTREGAAAADVCDGT